MLVWLILGVGGSSSESLNSSSLGFWVAKCLAKCRPDVEGTWSGTTIGLALFGDKGTSVKIVAIGPGTIKGSGWINSRIACVTGVLRPLITLSVSDVKLLSLVPWVVVINGFLDFLSPFFRLHWLFLFLGILRDRSQNLLTKHLGFDVLNSLSTISALKNTYL